MTIARRIAQFADYQRTVRALNALSDRQLGDLGIGRDSIRTVAKAQSL